MIRAFYNAGRVEELENGDGYDFENPNPKGYYDNILKVKFKVGDKAEFEEIDLVEFDSEKLKDYLYSNGSSRGGDNTPTTIVSNNKEPLKKLFLPIKKIEIEDFEKVRVYLENEENYKRVEDAIKEKFEEKEGYILTLVINEKMVGEYEELKEEVIKNNNIGAYYMKSMGTSLGKNKICYCCKEVKEEVYGYAGLYPFYTVDKKGFVAGGFKQEESWKNYPICPECYRILNKGKKLIEGNFVDTAFGMKYMVVPKSVLPITEEGLEGYADIIHDLSNEEESNKNKISLGHERRKILSGQEEFAFEVMGELKNSMSFNIMFYEESNASFKVLRNIEDVFPSKLSRLFELKDQVEESDVYKNLKSKKGSIDLRFTFNSFREFFGSNDNKGLLDIMNSVFVGKPIDYEWLLHSYIKVLREKVISGEATHFTIRNTLISLEVLLELDLLNGRYKGEVEKVIEKNEKNSMYLDFFKNHSKNFDTNLRKGLFLQGLMVQNLLNLPEQRSRAFYSRLNGLKMNEKIIKRIQHELIDKLEQYKKRHYYLELENLIGNYFALADFSSMSRDEMSYYFVLGMNMVREFKTNNDSNGGDQ